MKRLTTLLLLAALLSSLFTNAANAAIDFPDTSGHWAEADIQFLSDNHYVSGYTDGLFHPNKEVTRGEAATVLSRVTKIQFISRQNEPITRAEAAVLFARTFSFPEAKGELVFSDVATSHWAYDAIKRLHSAGIIKVSSNRLFFPRENITRAEFASMTARVVRAIGAVETDQPHLIDLSRWGIFNDGTHPIETTKGINNALRWANEQGITHVSLPSGTYLIDKNDHITMVSNMIWELGPDVIIQKETNGKELYKTIYVGPGVSNVTLRGGWYRGDRETHDYSGKDFPWSSGTHEGGYGIMLEGAVNTVIDGVKSTHFTGDGLCVCGYGQQINVLTESDFELGAVDNSGNLVPNEGKIRTKREKTVFNHSIFERTRTSYLSNPQGLTKATPYDLYFYKADGTFIKSIRNQEINWSQNEVPKDAAYFIAVFEKPNASDIRLEYWVKTPSRNITVKNSELAYNRRQGITIGGVDGTDIYNNHIHDIEGTAPQSGIDIEGGVGENGHPNRNIVIRNNRFENNAAYNVILYDGENVTVESNYLGTNSKKSTVGVAVSSPFRKGARIKTNVLDWSKIAVENESTFEGNEMKGSVASFVGEGITVSDMTFIDTQVRLNSTVPFGIIFNRVLFQNNNVTQSGLVLDKQPVHLKDVTIEGQSGLRSLSGNVADGSIFENLHISGYSKYGLDLPRGQYQGCSFEAAEGSIGEPSITRGGKYTFHKCLFENKQRGLIVHHADADVMIEDSTFHVSGNTEAIIATKAKRLLVNNNEIVVSGLTTLWRSAIKINEYGGGISPADVLEVFITNNAITTNVAAKGISTVDAGEGAPPYVIKDNVLYKAKLELKSNDLSTDNIEQ